MDLLIRESAARCAAGRPAKRISGPARVGMSGTHLILEASAQHACTSGRRPSVSLAAAGRRIRIGTHSENELYELNRLLERRASTETLN